MHGKIRTLLCAAAIVAASATPAFAITDGGLDGNGHPYVGLMVAQDAKGNPLWRCSGTLISPRLYLTAGHCTEAPAAHVEIWFDADVDAGIPENGYPFEGPVGGTPHTHPSYDPNAFFLFDMGMVVLDKPVKMKKYGALPGLNVLDSYATRRGRQDVTFTAVGYGQQAASPVPVHESSLRIRMFATPKLDQINTGFTGDGSMVLSNNANTGGTCFGDSGGPNFIGNTNIVGGVTSFGINGNCAGTGGVYRVDRSDDLRWIYSSFGGRL